MCVELAAPRFNRKTGCKPGIHAAAYVVDIFVTEIGECFCGDIAAMARLTIDDDMFIEFGAEFAVANLDLAEIDVQIRPWNKSRRMFFGRPDVDQDKALLRL